MLSIKFNENSFSRKIVNEDMSPLAIVELHLEVLFRYTYYSFSEYSQSLSEEDTCKDRFLCDYTFNAFFHLFSAKTL